MACKNCNKKHHERPDEGAASLRQPTPESAADIIHRFLTAIKIPFEFQQSLDKSEITIKFIVK